ncbi:PspC domain-containing protein [Microbispora bryophytorum]|uniref:PspC domain-containing protein n=1 Tax=Microbispora bryophytorum subsp. camponoti TaxID=1677852 RepID=A0ABR8L621_9ACTN|nr:PspC domain-containing protein [Microbispora camponoti]MBD3143949.1 PspC domain-containing protein [Microbispora camponoti]
MTEAPPTPAPDSDGAPEPEKVLSRSRDGRMITGVCAGLGRFTGMDPVLFRVGFAVLVLASGIGVLLYVAAFLLMRQPDGGPGHMEQWTRRLFDAETVLALLAAVFAFGLIINVASGGINRGTIVVGTLLAIVLMAARARGVDLLTMAKSMPERATGRRGMTRATPNFAPFSPFTPPPAGEPYGADGAPGAGAPTVATPPQAPAAGAAAHGPSAGRPTDSAVDDTALHGTTVHDTALHDTALHETAVQAAAVDDTAIHDTIAQAPAAPPKAVDDTLVRETVAGDAAAPAGRADGDPPTRPFEPLARLAAEPAPGSTSYAPDPTIPDPHATDPNVPGPHAADPHTTGPDVSEAPAGWAPGAPGPSVSAPAAGSGYRRLSDLAREARAGAYGDRGSQDHRHGMGRPEAGGHGYGAGEPFAPHGPYTRREPYQPYGSPYSPPSPYAPPTPPPARPARPKRPRSFVGGLTICLALIVGGIMVTMQRTGSGSVGLPVVGGAVLVTIGAGLLVAAWFGRGAALIAAGTIVALILVGSSTVNGIPRKVGSFVWHPIGTVQSPGAYELGIGEGKLDLSDVTLAPGGRIRFDASVSIGQLTVIVPSTARVEVHGSAKLGEVRIDHRVEDGGDVRFDRVLEPETPVEGDVPTIELYVKAGVGDVEVRRGA